MNAPTVKNFKAEKQRREGRFADAVTAFSGSMTFVVLHVIWFGGWVIANLVLPHPFDRFPFGLLTLIVSLEAIFLSTFVLISQNRQAAGSDRRALQDFQTNVYGEVLSELIADKLGVDRAEVQRRYRAELDSATKKNDSSA